VKTDRLLWIGGLGALVVGGIAAIALSGKSSGQAPLEPRKRPLPIPQGPPPPPVDINSVSGTSINLVVGQHLLTAVKIPGITVSDNSNPNVLSKIADNDYVAQTPGTSTLTFSSAFGEKFPYAITVK
jgi:hypothetical protein